MKIIGPRCSLPLLCSLILIWIHGNEGHKHPHDTSGNFTTFQNSNFNKEFFVAWSDLNVRAADQGRTLQLMLTKQSGTAVSSLNNYMYGYFRASIKLSPQNSAGTVTTFYLSSSGKLHDELDFEFLGNKTGEPCVLQTNVFANGTGGREERINLWFDPRAGFHDYAIIWNPQQTIFYVDEVVIRVFQNHKNAGQAYLTSQPMGVYSSIYDASHWATRGGLDKIDYHEAPFLASYTNYVLDACVPDEEDPYACATSNSGKWWAAEEFQKMGYERSGQMKWVRDNFLIYDYCTDYKRYSAGPPFECTATPF